MWGNLCPTRAPLGDVASGGVVGKKNPAGWAGGDGIKIGLASDEEGGAFGCGIRFLGHFLRAAGITASGFGLIRAASRFGIAGLGFARLQRRNDRQGSQS